MVRFTIFQESIILHLYTGTLQVANMVHNKSLQVTISCLETLKVNTEFLTTYQKSMLPHYNLPSLLVLNGHNTSFHVILL